MLSGCYDLTLLKKIPKCSLTKRWLFFFFFVLFFFKVSAQIKKAKKIESDQENNKGKLLIGFLSLGFTLTETNMTDKQIHFSSPMLVSISRHFTFNSTKTNTESKNVHFLLTINTIWNLKLFHWGWPLNACKAGSEIMSQLHNL